MNVREAVLTVDETQTSLFEGPSLIERTARTATVAAIPVSGPRHRAPQQQAVKQPPKTDLKIVVTILATLLVVVTVIAVVLLVLHIV